MDDEQKQPEQDETTQAEDAEGQAAEAAGPVSDGPSSPTGEDLPSSPPAADAAETEEPAESVEAESADQDDASEEQPSEEVAEEPAPKAEKPEPEEKKKDVIPGADLEPILVEPEGPQLSAEEQARLEAEEEEKARREAELQAADEVDVAASRAPAKMEKGARFLATGKRKSSIARVTLLPGNGKIVINKRDLEEFFPRPLHQTMVKQPLVVSGYEGNVDVRVRVHGGGISGQAGAVRHGVARALTEIDSELRGDLKRRGFLTRDARVKERRKAGLKKARKRPQFSKR